MKASKDLSLLKQDFPLLNHHADLVYLDSAATTHKPRCVINRMTDFYQTSYGTVHRAIYKLARESTQAYQNVRQKVKQFLNAQHEEEIIFTRGTTDALNLAAKSFAKSCLQRGDKILVTEIEHHSNLVPWQMVCQEVGAELIAIPVNERGEIDLESFGSLLDSRVKMVSLAHISNVIGTLHPIERIIQMAHACGAAVCVDGAQSAAHVAIDVQKLDVDFFAFSSHKLYGPTGVGVLYGKKTWLEKMNPVSGGGDMIQQVRWEHSDYQEPPLRFEAGTPSIVEVIGLGEALDYLSAIGLPAIQAWEEALFAKALGLLHQIPGLKIVGDPQQRGPLASFVVEGVHPLDLATLLDCKNIAIRTGHQCSQLAMERFGMTSTARFSIGLYNNEKDIEYFAHSLAEVIPFFRS